jgi:hypothetical protein
MCLYSFTLVLLFTFMAFFSLSELCNGLQEQVKESACIVAVYTHASTCTWLMNPGYTYLIACVWPLSRFLHLLTAHVENVTWLTLVLSLLQSRPQQFHSWAMVLNHRKKLSMVWCWPSLWTDGSKLAVIIKEVLVQGIKTMVAWHFEIYKALIVLLFHYIWQSWEVDRMLTSQICKWRLRKTNHAHSKVLL